MPACSEPLVSRQTLGTPPKPDKSDDKPQDDGPDEHEGSGEPDVT